MKAEAKHLAHPHINSYNRFVNTSLPKLARLFKPLEIADKINNTAAISIEAIRVEKPVIAEGKGRGGLQRRMLPSECRRTAQTYRAEILAEVMVVTNGVPETHTFSLGFIPVMVRSSLCALSSMTDEELVQVKEEPNDLGGYFIYKGTEKICRLLQIQKKYCPFGVYRPGMSKKRKSMSEHAVSYKSAFPSGQASMFTLHYCNDHSIKIRVKKFRKEYYIPLHLVLRGISGNTDREIEESLRAVLKNDKDLMEYVELLLQSFSFHKEYTQKEALSYLGSRFRLYYQMTASEIESMPASVKRTGGDSSEASDTDKATELLEEVIAACQQEMSDAECGLQFIKDTIAVHTGSLTEKYNLLIICIAKLFMQVSGRIPADNGDALSSHELITVGDTLTEIMADKIYWMSRGLQKHLVAAIHYQSVTVTDKVAMKRILKKVITPATSAVERLLSMGVISFSNMGTYAMMQQAGFTITAERLNYLRFFSHLRSVHRGSFFESMRTSTVRKLLPESWGFLCPVHTPDGSPCGLLTHLSHTCVVSHAKHHISVSDLISYGMNYLTGALHGIPVVQNGRVVGTVSEQCVHVLVGHLRKRKIFDEKFKYAEIVYDGWTLQIVNTPNRFMRPVINIKENEVEHIGPTEQMYIQIEGLVKDSAESISKLQILSANSENPDMRWVEPTHREITATNILSVVAGSTPLGNFNPSPRNMYQCQMAKQSMGTMPHTQKYRTDQKVYSLDYVQTPTMRTDLYSKYELGEYPNGKNITIAILSYTGYDIEDAVILNKASVNRGFMRGSIYKTEVVDFGDMPEMELGTLKEEEGLPEVGQLIRDREVIYTTMNTEVLEEQEHKNKTMEDLRVKSVSIYQAQNGKRSANITMRIQRIPTIGDKFSSRHGQKGVCSILYEDEDMPFNELGVTPDLIINPHAFPSRMSIGMFIENIASKAGACLGMPMDGSMFKYGEKEEGDDMTASEYFGNMLESAGFKRGGGETLYSGVTGTPLSVDVFFGIVYYQRLRHMVSDKYQVRTSGPIDALTKQPIGGRSKCGGIRLGEMERDVLISHGACSVINDRMLACSDGTVLNVCRECSSLSFFQKWSCTKCKTNRHLVKMEFPYVFKYLVAELASVNIQCKIKVERADVSV
ncbi:DNA-directed RNA polymerase I subunit RPA2 [Nematocida major]|uniref:DNA-directed RNA polymerase I subunit RPA2 n=1 Tax=Nematocida major TaxID=1912982 RepID=UPI00200844F9|nr:DNA-directed RNA polymerase I subunit RPA2 [Nematocida major]KAH9386057.1 DNA-directed RNA polymerase I subunit RPA2 [Nematocida major]